MASKGISRDQVDKAISILTTRYETSQKQLCEMVGVDPHYFDTLKKAIEYDGYTLRQWEGGWYIDDTPDEREAETFRVRHARLLDPVETGSAGG